jgi:hypothetical protein
MMMQDVHKQIDVCANAPILCGFRRMMLLGIVASVLTCAPRMALAGPAQKTFEDRFAESDIHDAEPDIDLLDRILGAELQRLFSGVGGAESEDAAFYLHPAPGQTVNLGDLRIPLTKRYIERERRHMAASIELAKTVGNPTHCGSSNPTQEQLLDSAIRSKLSAEIKCNQRRLDLMQAGIHKIDKEYEAMVLELRLPAFTQEKVLADARAYMLRQDAEMAAQYANPRKVLKANMDLLTDLDEHAADAYYADGHIVLGDPAEEKAMESLLETIGAITN